MTLTADAPQTQAAPAASGPITATGEGLRKALDGPFHAIKQRWRNEIAAEDFLRSPDMSMADAREWTLEKLIALANRKFAVAGFPEGHGGEGNHAESVAHFEMLAMGDLSLTIKSGVQHGLWGGALTNLGNDWHHATWIPDTLTGKATGCFAMTELGHGSDVQSIETTITWIPEDGEYEIHSPTPSATKAYIGNAGQHGKWAAVFGQLIVNGENEGVHVAVCRIREEDLSPVPGVTCGDHGHKGGLLGVDNGTITFDHVRVPRTHLLDRFGGVGEDGVYHSEIASKNARFFTMLGTLVRGRICVGGGAASATRKALSIATRYALERTQFRLPGLGQEILLMDYQTHQRKLLPNIAKAYAYGFAQNELALQLQRVVDAKGADSVAARELETRAAGMKALLTRWANDTIQVAREACGGAGFISENGLTTTRQDADVFATFEGDNTVLQQLVAKALLLDYKKSWGDMDMRGTAQATARMLGGTFLERTTAKSVIDRILSSSKSKDVTSRAWHIEMFEDREKHTVEGLAKRMRAAAKAEDAFAATNACQMHLIAAAKAHTDRVVLEAFIEGIEECEDPYITSILNKVCDLYALTTLEENRGWFMEHERFDGTRSKAITEALDALCVELRPKALELVEGLGVEESWLNAEIVR